ncbi:hypothetical protein K1719_029542 [Acacia pycnantha]|nr:hypothetical protein K1719_029542 [Acacia pycnantha]
MSLDRDDLKPCKTTLIGFNGEQSRPKGFIDLRFTLGVKDAFKSERVRFIVAEFVSPYNIILGRPTIHKWDMLVSTKHQKLKVIGNQGTVVTVTGIKGNLDGAILKPSRWEGGSSSQPQRIAISDHSDRDSLTKKLICGIRHPRRRGSPEPAGDWKIR